eukprot:scaffold35291_cov25-Tisochrysis_lutea.AAC.2
MLSACTSVCVGVEGGAPINNSMAPRDSDCSVSDRLLRWEQRAKQHTLSTVRLGRAAVQAYGIRMYHEKKCQVLRHRDEMCRVCCCPVSRPRRQQMETQYEVAR